MSKRKWLSPEEFAKAQAAAREARKKTTCAFNNYEDVTQEMVDKFWEKPAYAKNLPSRVRQHSARMETGL